MNYERFFTNGEGGMGVEELDFSTKEDFDLLMGWLHGEEVCKEKFPAFYETCVNARRKSGKVSSMREGGKGFLDGVSVSMPVLGQEREEYEIMGNTCLTEEPGFVLQRIEVLDPSGGVIVRTADADMLKGYTRLCLKLPKAQAGTFIKIVYFAVWSETDTLYGKVASRLVNLNYGVGPGIASFSLSKPVPGHGRDTVMVVYNRSPVKKEDVDYNYIERIKSGKQRAYLEVQGTAKMMSGAVIRSVDFENIELRLHCPGRGDADYARKITEDVFPLLKLPEKERAGKDFQIEFLNDWKDWGVDLPSARLPIRDKVDFEMNIPYELTNGMQGSLIASSTLEEVGNNVFHGAKLYLLWGCLAKDTYVNMANGSVKLIGEIKIGEMVLGRHGGQRVENVYTGQEEELICLQLETGRSICATKDHVFCTQDGNKKAGELCGADMLMTMDGPMELTGIYPVEGGQVYNLDLDGDGCFYAERILNGDLKKQNHVFKMAVQPCEETFLLSREIKELKQFMRE